MWISKKKWQALDKRIADLEVQVQGQHEILKTCLTPPVSCVTRLNRNASIDRNSGGGNTVFYGGGGINYDGLTIEALRDINESISAIGSLIKDGLISGKVEIK